MKKCTRCGVAKPLHDFPPRTENRAKLCPRCRECLATLMREYRKTEKWSTTIATPNRRRLAAESRIRSAYGVDFEDWARLYEKQNAQCAGCSCALFFDRRTNIDHHHGVGTVRGLLCHDCNMVLGRVKDRPRVLRQLADYLESCGLFDDEYEGVHLGPNDLDPCDA